MVILKHDLIAITLKMDPMKTKIMKAVMIPSGGHLGSDENTISGHEKLHIAK
jgi:hypothetical protein